jgi:anti-sigma-K factor RskA
MSADERELDELLGAYALDAVSDDERRAVEQYLMVEPRARQEVAEHRETASILAWSSMAAPEGLWDRIAAHLDEPAPTPRGELASVLQFDTDRGRSARARRWRTLGAWSAASAAAAVVAIVAVVSIGGNDRSEQAPLAVAVSEARADRDSTITTLVSATNPGTAEAVIDQDGHGYLLGGALPALPDDETYQLWGVIGDQVISLGVLGHNPEIELFSAAAPVSQLVVTIEQAGGVVSNGNPDGAYAGTVG